MEPAHPHPCHQFMVPLNAGSKASQSQCDLQTSPNQLAIFNTLSLFVPHLWPELSSPYPEHSRPAPVDSSGISWSLDHNGRNAVWTPLPSRTPGGPG